MTYVKPTNLRNADNLKFENISLMLHTKKGNNKCPDPSKTLQKSKGPDDQQMVSFIHHPIEFTVNATSLLCIITEVILLLNWKKDFFTLK